MRVPADRPYEPDPEALARYAERLAAYEPPPHRREPRRFAAPPEPQLSAEERGRISARRAVFDLEREAPLDFAPARALKGEPRHEEAAPAPPPRTGGDEAPRPRALRRRRARRSSARRPQTAPPPEPQPPSVAPAGNTPAPPPPPPAARRPLAPPREQPPTPPAPQTRVIAGAGREPEWQVATPPPAPGKRRIALPPGWPRLTLRRAILTPLLLVLAYALISYAVAMLQPSNVSLGVRSVEWLRNNGMAWLVNDVENIYYSLNAPKKGGPALKTLPKVGLGVAQPKPKAYQPPPIAPVIHPALPGEGRWHATGVAADGRPSPVLVTTFRPDPDYPELVAGVAWVDHTRTRAQLYPGRYEPAVAPARGPMEVPPDQRTQLVATFNSAFKLEDSNAGFFANGHLDSPLQDGLATLIGRDDGSVDLRTWEGGPRPGPGIAFARQNLPPIVENGHLNPNLSDGPEWGATLGNKIRVWRSAVGIDVHGNLLYAAANDQTVASLAQILRRAGAVEAMELDINYEWVSFNTFARPGAHGGLKLLPGMDRPPTRYLTPDDRDFFAVFTRTPSGPPPPPALPGRAR